MATEFTFIFEFSRNATIRPMVCIAFSVVDQLNHVILGLHALVLLQKRPKDSSNLNGCGKY